MGETDGAFAAIAMTTAIASRIRAAMDRPALGAARCHALPAAGVGDGVGWIGSWITAHLFGWKVQDAGHSWDEEMDRVALDVDLP